MANKKRRGGIRQRGLEARNNALMDGARAFVGSTHHVCPFGTMAEKQGDVVYAVISSDKRQDPWIKILKPLEELLAGKKALILAFPKRVTDMGESEELTYSYSEQLAIAAARINNPGVKVSDLKKAVYDEYTSVLRDPVLSPNIAAPDSEFGLPNSLVVTFMGPCYEDPTHARYAPHPMLIVTTGLDIAISQLQKPGTVKAIRKRITDRFGGIYDIDRVFVDFDPVITGHETEMKLDPDVENVLRTKLTELGLL